MIGGAAAAVAYDSGTKTADIDLFRGCPQIDEAARRHAGDRAGHRRAAAPVADLPYDYEGTACGRRGD